MKKLKNEDAVLTQARQKFNSSRLYHVSSAYPRAVTWSPLDNGDARYRQFTDCLFGRFIRNV